MKNTSSYICIRYSLNFEYECNMKILRFIDKRLSFFDEFILNNSTLSNKIKNLRSLIGQKMIFKVARLRVKELAEALSVDAPDIIAICILLKIPASSPLSSLSVEQCKEIIDYVQKKATKSK